MSLFSLSSLQAHLWCAEESAVAPTLLQKYEALLTEDEKARWRRFYFEADRDRFLLTRALVRTTLSRYAPVPPEDWRFVENAYGRPSIENAGYQWLRFNLSHTKGMVVCLVSKDREVGVDVEDTLRRSENLASIATHFFAPKEVEALKALPISEQRERFFVYWTLKESYIKARGMGLSLPLDKFAFTPGDPISLEVDVSLNDSPSRWLFSLHRLSERHQCAVALERLSEEASLSIYRTTPLLGERLA